MSKLTKKQTKIKEMLEPMKEIHIIEPIIQIKTSMSQENEDAMKNLAQNLTKG